MHLLLALLADKLHKCRQKGAKTTSILDEVENNKKALFAAPYILSRLAYISLLLNGALADLS
jgi:hypothetical protein